MLLALIVIGLLVLGASQGTSGHTPGQESESTPDDRHFLDSFL